MTPSDDESSVPGPPSDAPLSVGQITHRIKRLFDAAPEMKNVAVVGEISNFKHYGSGHMYFSLKDESATIRCVFFKGNNLRLRFKPADGMKVVARGSISVYPDTGSYQLYVQTLEESGAGELFRKFEELKKKLSAEGLTAEERKRALPEFPRRIGIVTSAESAALQDMLKTLRRRYPLAVVVLAPVAVEGIGAAPSIAAGLEAMAARGGVDVVIVGRGGGSIESLWAFNTEIVARAIVAMPVPTISAVGHETDFTIADMVADLRAPTPTAAAELVAPALSEIAEATFDRRRRLEKAWARALRDRESACAALGRALRSPETALRVHVERTDRLRDALDASWADLGAALQRRLALAASRLAPYEPGRRIAEAGSHVRSLRERAHAFVELRLRRHAQAVAVFGARVSGANPTAIMKRGYSVVFRNGRAMKDAAEAAIGDEVTVRLNRGGLDCVVRSVQTSGEEK